MMKFAINDDIGTIFTMILTWHRLESNVFYSKFFNVRFEALEDKFTKITFAFSASADFYEHIFLLVFSLLYPRWLFFQKKFAKIFFSI